MNNYSSRRRFLSQVGLAGAGIAASSVFALPSYSQGSGRTARATLGLVVAARRFQSAAVRRVPRTPRAVDLHGRLRPGQSALRRARLPQGRHQGSGRPARAHHPLPGRQHGLGLQLVGRRRPEEGPPHRARARLELDRDQPVRHQRLHGLGQGRGHRTACSGSTSAPAPRKWPWPTSNTATTPRAPSGATCAARMATNSRTR